MGLPSDVVRIRVRAGQSEAEIEADLAHVREAIELIPEIVAKFPNDARVATPIHTTSSPSTPHAIAAGSGILPNISVDKGDSLGGILSKFFIDSWGKSPRKLSDVREALQSYGLSYPKQSVAVALLRLAKASKIRRFKSEDGDYVYTVSTSLMPLQSSPQAQAGEGSEVHSTINV